MTLGGRVSLTELARFFGHKISISAVICVLLYLFYYHHFINIAKFITFFFA